MAARKQVKKKPSRKSARRTRSKVRVPSRKGRPRGKFTGRTEMRGKKQPARRRADDILGERLVHVRQQQGLTQLIAAKEAGIPYETFTGYERAEASPPFWRIRQLAIYYGVSLDYLAGRTDQVGMKKTGRKTAKKPGRKTSRKPARKAAVKKGSSRKARR